MNEYVPKPTHLSNLNSAHYSILVYVHTQIHFDYVTTYWLETFYAQFTNDVWRIRLCDICWRGVTRFTFCVERAIYICDGSSFSRSWFCYGYVRWVVKHRFVGMDRFNLVQILLKGLRVMIQLHNIVYLPVLFMDVHSIDRPFFLVYDLVPVFITLILLNSLRILCF